MDIPLISMLAMNYNKINNTSNITNNTSNITNNTSNISNKNKSNNYIRLTGYISNEEIYGSTLNSLN